MGSDTAQKIDAGLYAAAPFTGPAAPFVALAASLINLGDSIYHLFTKYDPQKLHDTAVVEAFEQAAHTIWYYVTGEALPGIAGVSATTVPGDYGAQGINLFQSSAYPNVPYPAGAPGVDVNAAIASLQATFQSASAAMQRPESIANIQGNETYMLGLLQQVAAIAPATSTSTGNLGDLITSIPTPAWIAGGIAFFFGGEGVVYQRAAYA